jgi:glyoxylase-like metal-dependent hydrolase (beta-lactamase superfamily II)
MKTLKLVAFLVFVVIAPQASFALTGEKAEFRKIADDVYAFIGKRNDANAMAIVTNEGVILVDTGNNPPETRRLQGFIKSVTDQPVRYVVISQNHGDHQGGTPLFAPPAHVVVQDRVYKDWAAWKPYQIKSWQRRFPERAGALEDIKPVDTAISFSDRMTLHSAARLSSSSISTTLTTPATSPFGCRRAA